MTPSQNRLGALDQAVTLLKQGRAAEAASLLDQVLKHSPHNSEALYYLSIIKFNNRQAKPAIALLKRALEARPDELKYMLSLASAYGHNGQVKQGIALLERGVQRNSANPDLHYNLGTLLVLDGQSRQAERFFEQAIKLRPAWPDPYCALAKLYQNANRYELAEPVLAKAIGQGLQTLQVVLQYSQLLEHQGETEKAKVILNQGLSAHPGNLGLMNELARLDKHYANEALQQHLSGLNENVLSPHERFCRLYMLALCARNTQAYQDEMALLTKAHLVVRESTRFNLDNDFYFRLLANRQPETPELEQTGNIKLAEYAPIFIVGVPRSGSTLIENVICSANSDVQRGEEVSAFSTAIAHSLKTHSNLASDNLHEPVTQIYESVGLLNKGRRFTDKSLENVLCIDLVLKLFPKAKIVYCEREPRASIISILRNVLSSLSWAHQIDEILHYFELCFDKIAVARASFPKQIYTFNYEAFVENSEEKARELLAFCDLDWDPACLEFYRDKNKVSRTTSTAQIRQGVNKLGLGAGREHAAFFEPYLARYPWLKPGNDGHSE